MVHRHMHAMFPQGSPPSAPKPGMMEFVALMAALMSMTALSIDAMLPAMPMIGADLKVAEANDRQQIITLFFLGIASGSLVYGPLSDRFGRKPVLLGAMGLFVAATLACALAPSFAMLTFARIAAGFFAASTRVLTMSIVRDCFQGDRMARIMSFTILLFIIVPILAPSFGTVILWFAPWRGIFLALALLGLLVAGWVALRLPETLHPDNRLSIRPADLAATFARIVTHRTSAFYMLGSGILFGALVGFIASVQQIFFDSFDSAVIFPFAFAGIAMWMGVGSFFNGHLVERIGARRMAHGALCAFVAVTLVHSLVAWSGRETLLSFIAFQGITMLSFSFAGSNLSAISLEPFARGAGLAASVQASLTTLISAGAGAMIGNSFDGTTLPLAAGSLSCGAAALICVALGERGKLFGRPGHGALRKEFPPPPPR